MPDPPSRSEERFKTLINSLKVNCTVPVPASCTLPTYQLLCAQVTDTSHTAGLTMHATILAYMFTLVEQDKITVPLGPAESNVAFIQVRAVRYRYLCMYAGSTYNCVLDPDPARRNF